MESIQPDRILLLDSYFMVIVHYGSTIAQWRKAGYHEQEEHENFRNLLAAPLADAEELLSVRPPPPPFPSSPPPPPPTASYALWRCCSKKSVGWGAARKRARNRCRGDGCLSTAIVHTRKDFIFQHHPIQESFHNMSTKCRLCSPRRVALPMSLASRSPRRLTAWRTGIINGLWGVLV